MKSQALKQFLQVVAADPALQEQCGAVGDLAQEQQRGYVTWTWGLLLEP